MMRKVFTLPNIIEKKVALKQLFWLSVLSIIGVIFLATPSQALRIEYGYGGEFGSLRIADTASAYEGSLLVAEAKAIRIIKKNSGPNWIEIEETHYSTSGSVIYRGKLFIRFGFGGGEVVGEEAISGRKRFSVFVGWPSG